MANPRKFSEKIALHNHRQAEETAAFEQIMKEVNEVTTKVVPERAKNTLRINTQVLGAFRGGSLPNVSAPIAKSPPQNTDKDEVPLTSRSPSSYRHHHEGRSRTRSQGGPMRRPHDRKLDTSPYSSSTCGTPAATYLSLPTDTGWRRTNSDSALHTSTMQGMMDRSNDVSGRGWNMPMMNGPDRTLVDRPRSSCDIPSATRVPGISIHPTSHDAGMQISIANTGSLPDLTNVDFSSPIHAPLDQDHDSSPYSSSPVNTSPSTLSPTSMPQGVRPPNRFHFPHTHSNHLSVPFSPNRYQQPQHMRKNVQLDKNVVNLVDSDFAQFQELTNMYQHCPPTSPSPTLQTATYRSPRPSPQSSPSPGGRSSAPCSPGAPSPLPNEYHILNQQVQFQQQFGQLSMDWAQLIASLMESGCTWTQLQLDTPQSYSNQTTTSTATSLMSQSGHNHTSTLSDVVTSMGGGSGGGNIELGSDGGYYSTSPSQQLVYPSTSPGVHTTTPNTPTSLPEIILTDFSGDDLTRQDSFSRMLPSEFFNEESLKEGLGSLDFDEIQILANPSYPISEIVEDNFRLDHRS